MINYTDTLISELWPQVARIEINTKQTYRHAFGVEIGEYSLVLTPDRPANFPFRCVNDDCTAQYFDLYSQVAGMVAHHQEHAAGTLECRGKEAKDHPLNRCPCTLDYDITIEYRKATYGR